ncbi:MAG: DUF4214 domain-containing protein [Oscillospiraceae bacterium]|nr:DUF4214 domain-containing protein [Oscillospiraceae bacterium]
MKKKSIISLLTVASLTASMVLPVYAENIPVPDHPTGPYDIVLADDVEIFVMPDMIPEEPKYMSDIQLYSYNGANTYNFCNLLTQAQKDVYKAMYAALMENKGASQCSIPVSGEYLNVSVFNSSYSSDVASPAFVAFVLDHPEFVGLKSYGLSYSYIGSQINGNSVTMTLNYCSGQAAGDTAVNSYTAVTNKVNSIVSAASAYSSNYEKLKFFAEYLCDNVTYNWTAANSNTGDNCWNAYGSLINGSGVCESYAEAFKLLCDAISVPCTIVVSKTHEWNIVYMNGAWYYVDVTWMDNYEVTGMYDYNWFMTGTSYASDTDHVLSSAAVLKNVNFIKYPTISSSPYVYTPSSGPSESDELILDFVERMYTKMLGRASEEAGKQHWFTELKNGRTVASVSYGFVFSEEIKKKNLSNDEMLRRMYRTFMNREADESGLAHWKSRLENGCTMEFIFMKFVSSPEFEGICNKYGMIPGTFKPTLYRDQSYELTAFISRLYTKALNRKYDADGLEHWTKTYITKANTLDEIARKIIFSQEFKNRNLSDEEFVDCMYATFFDRAPDAGGKAHWLNVLSSGGTREDVFAGFIRAAEYKNLVASFGLPA